MPQKTSYLMGISVLQTLLDKGTLYYYSKIFVEWHPKFSLTYHQWFWFQYSRITNRAISNELSVKKPIFRNQFFQNTYYIQ